MESGALPELFILPNDETKLNYIAAIKDTVLLKDIIQRNSIKEPKLLEDIFIYLVNNASNLILLFLPIKGYSIFKPGSWRRLSD